MGFGLQSSVILQTPAVFDFIMTDPILGPLNPSLAASLSSTKRKRNQKNLKKKKRTNSDSTLTTTNLTDAELSKDTIGYDEKHDINSSTDIQQLGKDFLI
ncbi:hypothetical protein ACTFIU_002679 [Dictyostelium citrinum]